MISLINIIAKARKSHFVKFGLPFLLMVVGGSFLTIDFQRVKFEERQKRSDTKLLELHGIDTKVNMKDEYEKIRKANENHEWHNIRGPRPYEDNTEFLRNRELQEKRLQQFLERGNKTTESDINPST